MFGIEFKSCFWGHRWTKWTQRSVPWLQVIRGKEYETVKRFQSRYCEKCNKMQDEEIRENW